MGKKISKKAALKDFASIIRVRERQVLILREDHDHDDDGEQKPTVSVVFDLTIGARATLRYGFADDATADTAFTDIQKDSERLGKIIDAQEEQWGAA